jgi:hypothetical protein
MIRMLAAAAILATTACAASATTLALEDLPPEQSIGQGSVLDFSSVAIGSSQVIPVLFGLGDTGRDESFNFFVGPEFDLISGSGSTFFLESVSCEQFGIGIECLANAVFRPTSLGDFLATYEFSALLNYTETHGEEAGEVFEEFDSFQVSFRGTGVAAVPLPPTAAASLAALGMLGWIGRRRRRS